MTDKLDTLQTFYYKRAHEIKKKFNRVVPFGDAIIDRWEKSKLLGFGKNTSIYDSAIIFGEVEVGENTWIGPHVILDGSGGILTIGSYCNISAGTQIYTHNSVAWVITGGKAEYVKKSTTIGSYVYIGPHVTISAGVHIGDHVIIGAHSYVDKDIPSYTMAFGSPARKQGEIVLTNDNNYIVRHINNI